MLLGDRRDGTAVRFPQNADHLLIGESGLLHGLSLVSGSQNLKHHLVRNSTSRSDALRPRIARLTKLLRLADDTEIALGSDVQVAASDGFKFLTIAGKGQGLETLLKNVPARRQKRRTNKTGETETPAA